MLSSDKVDIPQSVGAYANSIKETYQKEEKKDGRGRVVNFKCSGNSKRESLLNAGLVLSSVSTAPKKDQGNCVGNKSKMRGTKGKGLISSKMKKIQETKKSW
jgi:hypothetical protein